MEAKIMGVTFPIYQIIRMPFYGQDKFKIGLPNGQFALIPRTLADKVTR